LFEDTRYRHFILDLKRERGVDFRESEIYFRLEIVKFSRLFWTRFGSPSPIPRGGRVETVTPIQNGGRSPGKSRRCDQPRGSDQKHTIWILLGPKSPLVSGTTRTSKTNSGQHGLQTVRTNTAHTSKPRRREPKTYSKHVVNLLVGICLGRRHRQGRVETETPLRNGGDSRPVPFEKHSTRANTSATGTQHVSS